MSRRAFLKVGLSALLGLSLAHSIAEARSGGRLAERIAERRSGSGEAAARGSAAPSERLSYGAAKDQRILFYAAPQTGGNIRRTAPPLAIYIHGGGWSKGQPEMVGSKPEWFAQHGWAFASIGYRLLPEAPVEEQARDIGRAIAKLRAEAARLGFDPDRILLTGHSAGAHLAALVGTEPAYAGASFAAIRGVIPIDGACYDVVTQMQQGGRFMQQRTYLPAFGSDPARQRALSPTTHAGGRDAPDWLLLYTTARADAKQQSDLLATALTKGAARAEVFAVPARTQQALSAHRAINVEFGTAGYAANDRIEALMQRIAG